MMSKPCKLQIGGGKGNMGMFMEKNPNTRNICAAGLPSAQSELRVADCLKHYLLQEEVDALVNDAVMPAPKPQIELPLRRPRLPDMRNAGPFSEAADLINPPVKTKVGTLVEDLKNTNYNSYWKKSVGNIPDPVPMLPVGCNIYSTTFGKKTAFHGRLYDVVMPNQPITDSTTRSRLPSIQKNRNYNKSFNSDITFGHKTNLDRRGILSKCCLTDDRTVLGTTLSKPINVVQANIQDRNQAYVGTSLQPNNNIACVPDGFTFGILLKPSENINENLTTCELNPDRKLLLKCLQHLNNLRKCLSKQFEATFFKGLYLNLKYYDKNKTGWLPKELIYKFCFNKFIRFNPELIEPLLEIWNAFDGSQINYKTFVHVINFKESSPELPKVHDIPKDCIDFRTTYSEMVKTDQRTDTRLMAGVPSGRYFDLDYPVTPNMCCKADRAYLPEESDARACLYPSLYTLMGVSHRDMYARRPPETIRRVFEAGGKKNTKEKFDASWQEAQKYHSQGWVCYETFRRALDKMNMVLKETQ